MTSKKMEDCINNFVVSFLKEKGTCTILQQWKQESNMVVFRKMLTKVGNNEKNNNYRKKKRPKTAYNFFCSANREKAKKELGIVKTKNTEIFSELGRMWQKLKIDSSKNEELTKYKELAAKDKIKYEKELLTGNDPLPDYVDEKNKKHPDTITKKRKHLLLPETFLLNKNFQNHIQFSIENRKFVKDSNPDMKVADITKKLADMWKENISI